MTNETNHSQTRTDPDLVDVRDMVVVHTAMLREFRLASAAVRRVAIGEHKQAKRVEAHLDLLCGLLHHHHSGEDELLWPVLGPRLAPSAEPLLAVAEAQHGGIDAALEQVNDARLAWALHVDESSATRLADALGRLHELLAEHLEYEERHLLPLAAAHLSEGEWHAIGEAGAASVPKPDLLLVFGMFAYEGDPEVLKLMLASAPGPVRFLVSQLAPGAYARRAQKIYGTRRP